MSPTLKSETVKDLSLTLLAKNTRALSQKPRPLFLGTNAAGRTASYIGSSSPHPSVSSGEGLMLLTCNAGDPGSIPGSGRSVWSMKQQPTPVFLLGKFQGQRNLTGYSPWGRKELDMTEQMSTQEPRNANNKYY